MSSYQQMKSLQFVKLSSYHKAIKNQKEHKTMLHKTRFNESCQISACIIYLFHKIYVKILMKI